MNWAERLNENIAGIYDASLGTRPGPGGSAKRETFKARAPCSLVSPTFGAPDPYATSQLS